MHFVRSAFPYLLSILLTFPVAGQAAGLTVYRLDATPSTLGTEIVKGRVNVVMIWTTYCPVCRVQIPIMSKFHDAHRNHDATVLGIALAEPEDHAKITAYQTATGQSFPSVIASPESMFDAFAHATGTSFTGTPTYLLIDADGALRSYLVGPTTEDQLARMVAALARRN